MDRIIRSGLRTGKLPAARKISLGRFSGNDRVFCYLDPLGIPHRAGSPSGALRSAEYPMFLITPAADAAGMQSPYRGDHFPFVSDICADTGCLRRGGAILPGLTAALSDAVRGHSRSPAQQPCIRVISSRQSDSRHRFVHMGAGALRLCCRSLLRGCRRSFRESVARLRRPPSVEHHSGPRAC